MNMRRMGGFITAGLLLLSICSARADAPSADVQGLSFSTALQRAVEQAPSLSAINAGIHAAQASAIAAPALPDPKFIIGADNVPISGADRGNFSRDFMTMEKIGVMQEFPNGDKRRARADIAAAAIAKTQADQVIERQKVRELVATAWINRWYLERELALFDELDQAINQYGDALRTQFQSGSRAAPDALLPAQAAIELADRRDDLTQTLAQARAELRRWLSDDAEMPLQGEPPQFAINVRELHQHVHRHPELAAFGPMTAQAEAELREVEADKKPDVDVEVVYQRRSELFSDMVSVQFTMDLPVFAATRQTPRVEAKRQALAQLDNERLAMVREHSAELDSDIAQYTRIEQQLARLNNSRLPLAQQRVDVQMASYRAGQADLAAVIAARRESIETHLKQLELQNQQAALAAKLFFAYGEQP
ncbi:MAG TPA: TolC family protein [Spongiibacteraceae bacterium]